MTQRTMKRRFKDRVLAKYPKAACLQHGFGYIVRWAKWRCIFGETPRDAWRRAYVHLIERR